MYFLHFIYTFAGFFLSSSYQGISASLYIFTSYFLLAIMKERKRSEAQKRVYLSGNTRYIFSLYIFIEHYDITSVILLMLLAFPIRMAG